MRRLAGAAGLLGQIGRLDLGLVARRDLLDVFEPEQHLIFGQRLRASAKTMTRNSLMIWRSPSFCTRSASQHRLQRAGHRQEAYRRGQPWRHYIMRRAAPASISGSLIHRAAIIQAAPALVSLALRELASNRVLPAAPTARLAIAASPHARPSELCRPRAAWRIDTHPCRPNKSASLDPRASPGTRRRRPRMDRPASVRAPARPNPSAPLRKSTGLVATNTRTVPDNPITRRPSGLAALPRSS